MVKRLILCLCGLIAGCAVATHSTRPEAQRAVSNPTPDIRAESSPAVAPAQPKSLPASVLARWDTDADGRLSSDEQKAMRTHYLTLARRRRQQWELKRFDKDKDGKLSKAEKAVMDASRAGPDRLDPETVKRWDVDHDGRLSDEETRTMRAATETERRKLHLDLWDANGDGRVDAEEARVAREYERVSRMRPYTPWQLQRYDRNSNGLIDDIERTKLKADERRDRRMRTRRGPRPRR